MDNDTATATWYWCNSSTSTTPATHTCSGSSAAFGRREDVPIPGTNFDGDSTTPEIAVFRPSDGKVYVSYLGTANSLTINTNWSANQPAPYFGHFDIDNRDGPYLQKTDVALYDPDTATFRLLLSTGNWTGSGVVTRDFCVGLPTPCKFLPQGSGTSAQRAGAVPVFGLRRYATHSQINRTRPLGALALWDPSDKTWNVQWQPTASSALTTHMWGDLGDVLVGDGVGMAKTAALAQNGKTSDLVVYRSESNAGPGELWRCPFTSGGLFCDSGTQQTISVPEGTKSTAAFSLSDFGGDDKPELCTLSANNSTVSCYTSDSGYASSVVLTFSQLGGTFL